MKNEKWDIMYANVRGIKSKLVSLSEVLNDRNPHLFLITETLLQANSGIHINGYTFFGRKREGKTGGGVGVLVRNDIRNNVAAHISNRNIEMMWVSIRRKNLPPLITGVYYGKQESRTSKTEIETEMQLLNEEIEEMSYDGEIMIAMDANAKIGLLGEEVSRNGHLILKTFENTGLHTVNGTDRCYGSVTRQNTKNSSEKSAIDFIVTTETVKHWIKQMTIDEAGLYRIKGKNESDHNTITLSIEIESLDKTRVDKKTIWNLKASPEKWELYANELDKRCYRATSIITNPHVPINIKYKKWFNEIEQAARVSIGKSTVKTGSKEKISNAVKNLQKQKREKKIEIRKQTDSETRNNMILQYKDIQECIHNQMVTEKTSYIENKFNQIAADRSRASFWKEKRRMTRNHTQESLTVKDENGNRKYEPEEIKECMATYYENLYRHKTKRPHPYHQEVITKIQHNKHNYDYDHLDYNLPPSKEEVRDIIDGKKNGKSTPDIQNEMLKKPGERMIDFIYPLITTIWMEEQIPSVWNEGTITSLWKGKGDKELLSNHRGITTSSSIGTIIDSLIDKRIEKLVPFTEAQGGGKTGASTCDHLFMLRAIIALSKKQKRQTFITFYDVSKAYDNVDNQDMSCIMWDNGLRGKSWRLLFNLNTDLKAHVKTRFGKTRNVNMEIGGKQGSRLTGRQFSKLMDTLAESLINIEKGFKMSQIFRIPVLLWVDDVVSCVEGKVAQINILKDIDNFAVKHKLEWSTAKCKVMRVGKHMDEQTEWRLGDKMIQETTQYRYLGDEVTNDGKNAENIKSRKQKIQATTATINTIASSEVISKVESTVLLELHERITIPALLNNCESWVLNKTETDKLERVEIQALKNLFRLPPCTPNPAVIFTFGTLFTRQRIDQKQLIFLHKILNRHQKNWTLMTLNTLAEHNIGWAKAIKDTLQQYSLPTQFDEIKIISKPEWTKRIKTVIETKNLERLKILCYKSIGEEQILKTKTSSIVPVITEQNYKREPQYTILRTSKQETKSIIMARYGLLECGKNFKGTLREICDTCCCIDDEKHRLNLCVRWKDVNLFDSATKLNYDLIYSNVIVDIRTVMTQINKIWDTRNTCGTMQI